jgi:hypothetical protein
MWFLSFCDKRENLSRGKNIGRREKVHKNLRCNLGFNQTMCGKEENRIETK